MGCPDEVRVGPLTYRVLLDAASIRTKSDQAQLKGDAWEAFSDHDALVIGINPSNPVEVQRRDVLHEVLHCCLRLAGVWPNAYAETLVRSKNSDTGYTIEEFVVAAQSGPLLMVLRDNPALLCWLTD